MKLRGLIDEKFSLPGNAGREFGEKFIRDLIGSGKLANLWTAFEATYPELQSDLQATFEKSNELLRYIKPGMGDETYKVSSIPEAAAQELDNLLQDVLETLEFISSQNESPGIEMVKSVVKDFDNTFSDMLAIFTSNTDSDKPLEPYKQSNIGFGLNEHTVTFTKDDMAKLHNNGELVKADEDGKDHTYKFNELDEYYVDAMSEDEDYCPSCANKLREIVKKSVAECWKTHKQVGMKKKGDKTVPNCVPKNEAKTKPAKGKRFAKKVKNPKTGRTRTVSYGQKGKAKKGGDRIRPGTAKGNAYCARSAKIKKCKNPPCANALSRKKWKCQGSRSVK